MGRGFQALVLTNAMKPMWNRRDALAGLRHRHAARLQLRVSIDHHSRDRHETERGPGTWTPMLRGLRWLQEQGFEPTVAGRVPDDETEAELRDGYAGIVFPTRVSRSMRGTRPGSVLFPEMDETRDVPEITRECWDLLSVRPEDQMCATARMVVKRRGSPRPVVVACTLLPHDPRFELGATLAEARRPVRLNHPHCARFCVLGGASCSAGFDRSDA